jgi:hypothetical protein
MLNDSVTQYNVGVLRMYRWLDLILIFVFGDFAGDFEIEKVAK